MQHRTWKACALVAFVMAVSVSLAARGILAADAPPYRGELLFPLRHEHNHAPGLVECANGDLIASWYRGHGERDSDDVAVYGARLRKGETQWSPDFLMYDTPGFPDCNTCMMIDPDNRLWLFWPVIIANSWESAQTNYLYSRDYLGDGPPKWQWHDVIYLKPADYSQELKKHLEQVQKARAERFAKMSAAEKAEFETRRRRKKNSENRPIAVDDKMYQRLGWQGRCKPTLLPVSDRHPHGRILLPLYCDTFSLGMMAISDDKGRTWSASQPVMGAGAIQPSVVPRRDGTLVAYMRDNGGSRHIKISESQDDGQTWGPVTLSELANPGAGIDAVRLANGHFCLVYNDVSRGRNSLAVSISNDEGKSWRWTRHLEQHEKGSYHYPCVIQGHDGTIHSIYSYSNRGESMKHAAFTEAWVKLGDK
jgi:predicted neuraminidase